LSKWRKFKEIIILKIVRLLDEFREKNIRCHKKVEKIIWVHRDWLFIIPTAVL
jgi:hypothetical protein